MAEEIVNVLRAHAPILQKGVYVEPIDKWNKKLKPRLVTKDINLFDFLYVNGSS